MTHQPGVYVPLRAYFSSFMPNYMNRYGFRAWALYE